MRQCRRFFRGNDGIPLQILSGSASFGLLKLVDVFSDFRHIEEVYDEIGFFF